MEIILYLLVLLIGFAGGLLVSQMAFGQRLEQRIDAAVAALPPPAPAQTSTGEQPRVAVNVNVNDELVARYLATFNLVAVPRDVLHGLQEPNQTRH